MRVCFARVCVAADVDRIDSVAEDGVWCWHALDEFFEPGFETESVVQDQVGSVCGAKIAGGWFVPVDFRTRLGDGLDA